MIGDAKDVIMEDLWDWDKVAGTNAGGEPVSGAEHYDYFKKNLWFDFGKSIWSKHRSAFQYNVKYIHNEIMKPFRVSIPQYAECIHEMYDLYKYLPFPSKKGDMYD